MRYLKRFNESKSSSDIESNYDILKDVLQSELFDELDIEIISNSVIDLGNLPRNKCWAYIKSEGTKSFLYNPDIHDEISCICIFNIKDDERDRVDNILGGLSSIIKDMTGCILSWYSEEFVDFEDGSSFSTFDYTIELKNKLSMRLFENFTSNPLDSDLREYLDDLLGEYKSDGVSYKIDYYDGSLIYVEIESQVLYNEEEREWYCFDLCNCIESIKHLISYIYSLDYSLEKSFYYGLVFHRSMPYGYIMDPFSKDLGSIFNFIDSHFNSTGDICKLKLNFNPIGSEKKFIKESKVSDKFDVIKDTYGYNIKFSCSFGIGRATLMDREKFKGRFLMKEGEMFLFGIETTPRNSGVGRIFLRRIFDYFKLSKIYLPSSGDHPVWNKIATKTDLTIKMGNVESVIFTLTKEQLG